MNANLNKFEEGTPKVNIIKFSHNWNSKLSGDFFTTIRNADKYSYYQLREGEIFDVVLDGKHFCQALLKDVSLKRFEDMTPELLVLDTGTTDYKELFEKFHVKDICTLLLFQRVKK
jgi:hypothetical protein